jgi:proline dehydrogenase
MSEGILTNDQMDDSLGVKVLDWISDAFYGSLRVINEKGIKTANKFEIGRQAFKKLGGPYIAGHTLREGLEEITKYWETNGQYSTFDILGEAAKTNETADRYRKAYGDMIDMLSERFTDVTPATISVKPTGICAVTKGKDRTIRSGDLEIQLEKILSHAKEKGINVTLDMEDYNWTNESLLVAQSLWHKGYDNLGIVLQSRMLRNYDDIENHLERTIHEIPKDKIRVRACIGIYREGKDIATTSKRKAKRMLVRDIKKMFEAGIYVEIATHDHKVINEVVDYIKENDINSDRFEFQFLKGVQKGYEAAKRLQTEGYKTRFYMPTEIKPGDGDAYIERRLCANPELVVSGARNLFHL